MSATELDNLVRVGKLKREPPTAGEVEGLIRSGRIRLQDAAREDLALESRFEAAELDSAGRFRNACASRTPMSERRCSTPKTTTP